MSTHVTGQLIVDGGDLYAEYRRLLRLDTWRQEGVTLTTKKLRLHVTRHRRTPRSSRGWYKHRERRIHLSLYPDLTWGDACETLLHELAHAACEHARPRGHVHHGSYWKRVYSTALMEAYGVEAAPGDIGATHYGYLRGLEVA